MSVSAELRHGRQKREKKKSFSYRRHPDHRKEFKYECEICKPERRFKKPQDKGNHDKDKHGSSTCITPKTPRPSENSTLQMLYTDNTGLSVSSHSLDTIKAENLNSFVVAEIQPNRAYNRRCKAVVNRLCLFMQKEFKGQLTPSEIRKCGSLGKGTAVKGKSDADLVVFLENFHTMPELQENLDNILREMEMLLYGCGKCKVEGRTSHAVKVSVSCDGHSHSVDILPSVNILKLEKKKAIYKEMARSPHDRKYYSVPLAPLQVAFVAAVPTKVKTLIRVIKYWRKMYFEESAGDKKLPSSYPLELIVIGEWKKAKSPKTFDLHKGLFHVATAIKNFTTLKHSWNSKSNSKHACRDSYYVMDPANPFNDVMKASNCWEMVAEKAESFLKFPLFHGLTTNDGWV